MKRFWILDFRGLASTCFVAVSTMVFFLLCVSVEAQQPKRIPRIGLLIASASTEQQVRLEAFRQGLRELGYVEGKNINVELRSGEGKAELLPNAAAELVRLNVDVIVTGGITSTYAAKKATSTIPIVMTQDNDPVGSGFVVSLAHPGGNITGLSNSGGDLGGKRLELLKEVVPKLYRVAVLITSREVQKQNIAQIKEIETSGEALRLHLQILELRTSKDIEPAFQTAVKERAGAVLVSAAAVLLSHRKEVAELAIRKRLPVMYGRQEFIDVGGLLVYAASVADLSRRAAVYVDKILKGAKPAEIPVEQPTKFEFVVNLKAAKQIDLVIPPDVLARAHRVIR